MKTVILVRHAKSSWKRPELSDLERPLNKRGQRDAPMMGQRLAARGVQPELLITSPATRARLTAAAIAAALGYDESALRVDERIYHGGAHDILTLVRELDDTLQRVMIFGHNPDLTELANSFDRGAIDNVPTCGVVELDFDVELWSEIDATNCVRLAFDYPKRTATG
jgi:phosphohistidine phosphatase